MNRTAMVGLRLCGGAALAGLVALAGCTKGQLTGESPAYAVVDSVAAATGVKPTEFFGNLNSDVQTAVKKDVNNQQVCVAQVFNDLGRVTMHLALKDPGSAGTPTSASPANTITFTGYHVEYTRADGRNTPGVDVPYGFDGAFTMSLVGDATVTGGFVLVRIQAKEEAPLRALVGGGGARAISTIAKITFYGTDAAGRSVTATGTISVDFTDWGDPDC